MRLGTGSGRCLSVPSKGNTTDEGTKIMATTTHTYPAATVLMVEAASGSHHNVVTYSEMPSPHAVVAKLTVDAMRRMTIVATRAGDLLVILWMPYSNTYDVFVTR